MPIPELPFRRVLLDMSGVDFRTRTTGIPRVAFAYLEELSALGVDVIPVHLRDGRLVDARALLFQSNVRSVRRRPSPRSLAALGLSVAYFVLHVLRLAAVTCVVPVFAVLRLLFSYAFFDIPSRALEGAFSGGYRLAKDWVNRLLLRPVRAGPGDVLFMPAYWHDVHPGHYRALHRKGVRICPFVHDVLPITHPHHYEAPWRDLFARWVPEVLSFADTVFYASAATRDAVAAIQARRRLPLAGGVVLHHGVSLTLAGRKRPPATRAGLGDPAPFFLMVGTIEPKKNHLRVVAEFERLWRKGVRARLVLVGGEGWRCESIRSELRNHPARHTDLVWLEGVGDDELLSLYRSATALIQPSEAEGFGLPVAEAHAVATHVLANDIPVFRELGGDTTFFDMNREGELAACVEELLATRVRRALTPAVRSWADSTGELLSHLDGVPRPGAVEVRAAG